jgi:hypothetical protein
MSASAYARIAAIIFALIALLQLVRALLGWPVTVGGAEMPVWPSWSPLLSRRPWRGSVFAQLERSNPELAMRTAWLATAQCATRASGRIADTASEAINEASPVPYFQLAVGRCLCAEH